MFNIIFVVKPTDKFSTVYREIFAKVLFLPLLLSLSAGEFKTVQFPISYIITFSTKFCLGEFKKGQNCKCRGAKITLYTVQLSLMLEYPGALALTRQKIKRLSQRVFYCIFIYNINYNYLQNKLKSKHKLHKLTKS